MKKVIVLIIVFFLGGWFSRIAENKGVRGWDWIMDRVVQSEQDHHYLQQCLSREEVYIEIIGYEPDWDKIMEDSL